MKFVDAGNLTDEYLKEADKQNWAKLELEIMSGLYLEKRMN